MHAFVAAPNGLITAPDLRCACGNLSKTCNLRWEEVGPLPLPSIDVYSHLSADQVMSWHLWKVALHLAAPTEERMG